MKKKEEIKSIDLETDHLLLKRPTKIEQYDLWNIQRNRDIYRYYMSIPDRFNNDRDAFEKELNDWEKQKKYYYGKIDRLDEDSDKYTWSAFLKSGEFIGQMTVQPNKKYADLSVRNIGWVFDPNYQGKGYATEAARAIIKFMFEEVEIDRIETEANVVNEKSWRLMDRLGFERVGDTTESSHLDDNGNRLLQYHYILTRQRYISLNYPNYKKRG